MVGVEQHLARVFGNLLSNAVKFSPVGGTVTVTLDDSDSDELEIRVSDEGPGIPIAEQEAVWDRFYRVQSPQHSDVSGTGLGLPIVQALVQQRIGGSIQLRSDGSRGTTVVVRIPRVPSM
jgi:signal transduction histidine kinase